MFNKLINHIFDILRYIHHHPLFIRIVPLHIREKLALMFYSKIYLRLLNDTVRLEASTICQLKCRTCLFQGEHYAVLGKGYLTFDNFKRFCESNRYVRKIELSNSGEIFLNPDLIHIIKYAFENGITLTADGGVNFNTVSDEVIEALVKYRFKLIRIALDGACQETYSQYRINGNFDKVIENIKRLNHYKNAYNSKLPTLYWQYVLMQHNEEDVIPAKQMAKELDMTINFKVTWDVGYIPQQREMLTKETGLNFLSQEEIASNLSKKSMVPNYCLGLWTTPQINWDGRLLGCCMVLNMDFGVNVFEVDLEKALNSTNYKYAKEMVQGKVPPPQNTKNIPCCACWVYKEMRKTGRFFRL
jgi:MoaA/NifB/PqqE/SkfB family radical SAM enzyme